MALDRSKFQAIKESIDQHAELHKKHVEYINTTQVEIHNKFYEALANYKPASNNTESLVKEVDELKGDLAYVHDGLIQVASQTANNAEMITHLHNSSESTGKVISAFGNHMLGSQGNQSSAPKGLEIKVVKADQGEFLCGMFAETGTKSGAYGVVASCLNKGLYEDKICAIKDKETSLHYAYFVGIKDGEGVCNMIYSNTRGNITDAYEYGNRLDGMNALYLDLENPIMDSSYVIVPMGTTEAS